MTNDSKLTILTEKLRLPSAEQLEPWLAKLIKDPESLVIIAIEKPLSADGPRVATGWFSHAERVALRKALLAVNARREKKGQRATTEMPGGST